MAIIDCPECGGEISDKADHCVHCGVAVFVCPECGKVSLGQEKKCAFCGYVQNQSEKIAFEQNTNEASEDIIDQWKKANSDALKTSKILKYISWASICIPVIIGIYIASLLIGVYFPLRESGNSDLELLAKLALNHYDYLQGVNAACSICIPVAIIMELLELAAQNYWKFQCAKWVISRHISVKEIYKSIKEEEGRVPKKDDPNFNDRVAEKSKQRMQDLREICFLASDLSQKTFYIGVKAMPKIFICVGHILVSNNAKAQITSYMNSVYYANEFSFNWIELILIFVISIAIGVVLDILGGYIIKKKSEKVFEKMMKQDVK